MAQSLLVLLSYLGDGPVRLATSDRLGDRQTEQLRPLVGAYDDIQGADPPRRGPPVRGRDHGQPAAHRLDECITQTLLGMYHRPLTSIDLPEFEVGAPVF